MKPNLQRAPFNDFFEICGAMPKNLLMFWSSLLNVSLGYGRYFRTPLHGALEDGDESMANLLLKAGASASLGGFRSTAHVALARPRARWLKNASHRRCPAK